MKKYTEMTKSEMEEIIKRGGNDLRELNRAVSEHLHSLNLSERAIDVIAATDINCMAQAFYNLMTAEEVEEEIVENYPEEEE